MSVLSTIGEFSLVTRIRKHSLVAKDDTDDPNASPNGGCWPIRADALPRT